MIRVDQTRCAGCATCVTVCPDEAIECPGMAVIDNTVCTQCLECLDVCPTDAISYWETEKEKTQKVVAILAKEHYANQES